MRGEMDALRKIAQLASEYLELDAPRRLDEPFASKFDELRDALDDLRTRFPYTLRDSPTDAFPAELGRAVEAIVGRPAAGR